MSVLIETLNHDFRYRNGTLIANSTVIDVQINVQANQNTTISMIINSDISLLIGDELRFKAWYGSNPSNILDPGSFYVDSYTRVQEGYKIDGVIIPFQSVTVATINYVNQTLNQIVAGAANSVSLFTNISPNGTFIAGTAPNTTDAVIHSSNTTRIDAFYQLGKLYAYFSYIWNFQLYSVEFSRYWFDPLAPFINGSQLIENEWQENSIDKPKTINTIRWSRPSPGFFTPADIGFIEWGATVDLTSEGFYENSTSANNRLRGFVIENTNGAQSRRIKVPALIGDLYLPGRKVFVTDLTGLSSPWIIRSHTWNYNAGGFTSTLDLQSPQYT